jgi:dolichyl-phosphate-mannose-protein mannosyltransferase
MATRNGTGPYLKEEKGRAASRSPARQPNGENKVEKVEKPVQLVGYTSEGVEDNDIFDLPSSDWQLLSLLTIIGSFVRLFRIYLPTSVVFDEVQYVQSPLPYSRPA